MRLYPLMVLCVMAAFAPAVSAVTFDFPGTADVTLANNTTFDEDSIWANADGDNSINLNGFTLTNDGATISFTAATDIDLIGGAGSRFVNKGTFNHTGTDRLDAQVSTVNIDNEGLWHLNADQAGNQALTLRGGTFLNTGIVRKSAGGVSRFEHGSAGVFSNQGTVEVNNGNFDIDLDIAQYNLATATLTGGIWHIIHTAGSNATLSGDHGAAGFDAIAIIGPSATVVMGGANPVWIDLTANLNAVQGTLGVQGGYEFNTVGDLDVTGTLQFGLSDLPVHEANPSLINVIGEVSFDAGSFISILDLSLDGLDEGSYLLMTYDTLNGLPTLLLGANVPGGSTLDFSVDGEIRLTVRAIPEPATTLLGLMGLGGLMLRRRRHV